MSQSSPVPKKLLGCLGFGCLGVIVGTPLILSAVAYGVLFHTSIPLRFMVKGLKAADSNIELNAISGSAFKGFEVKEVVLKGEADEPDSRLEGVTFKFNGFLDIFLNKRLIIDEISVKRADLIAISQ